MVRAFIPAEIKRMHGTYRPDRDKQSAIQSVPMSVRPAIPDSLKDTGVAKWNEWVDILESLKLLERRYLDALEMYCRAWDRLVHYEGVIQEQGEFTVAESGYICAHPATALAKQAREEIRRYQTEFGFTPSSASSVATIKKAEKTGVPSRRRDLGGGAGGVQ